MTVAVAQPPVVSEMYAAVTPLFVGCAASTFTMSYNERGASKTC